MEDKLLDIMEQAKVANLDLFTKYYRLADEYKAKGDLEKYNYWHDRAAELSISLRKIDEDVSKLMCGSSEEYLNYIRNKFDN